MAKITRHVQLLLVVAHFKGNSKVRMRSMEDGIDSSQLWIKFEGEVLSLSFSFLRLLLIDLLFKLLFLALSVSLSTTANLVAVAAFARSLLSNLLSLICPRRLSIPLSILPDRDVKSKVVFPTGCLCLILADLTDPNR